ncbi:porin [Paraburkholderia sp. ZP32-5]|uniref:porin n=1 Tax=Paraburkholderia sp. ZP32-5 TaxID=2883245 RepID=UPI001F31A9D6|nr:porin [Paraburkholderia sp. ZP32-5]
MRRRLVVIAVLGALSSPAFSQSSVTLYGILDAGLNYTVGSQKAIVNGRPVGAGNQLALNDGAFGMFGSRWGLKGTEDLGSGLKAIFTLENGFSMSSGAFAQGGAEFGRQAFVGLDSPYGRLTLGRQYDPHLDIVAPFSAAWQFAGYIATHAADVDNLLSTRRLNNSIKYTMPKFHGVNAEALYSVGGVAGSVSRNQAWSLAVGYDGGPFQFGAGYLTINNPNVSFYGANPNGTGVTGNNLGSLGSATSPANNPAYAGFASANRYNLAGVGASYTYGSATAGVIYTNVRYTGLGDVATSGPNPLGYSGTAAINTVELNLRYFFTPTILVGVMGSLTRVGSVGGHDGASYRQFGGGAHYFLSKATELYALVMYEHATGVDSTGRAAVAAISGLTPSSTSSQTAVRVGIVHRF